MSGEAGNGALVTVTHNPTLVPLPLSLPSRRPHFSMGQLPSTNQGASLTVEVKQFLSCLWGKEIWKLNINKKDEYNFNWMIMTYSNTDDKIYLKS